MGTDNKNAPQRSRFPGYAMQPKRWTITATTAPRKSARMRLGAQPMVIPINTRGFIAAMNAARRRLWGRLASMKSAAEIIERTRT